MDVRVGVNRIQYQVEAMAPQHIGQPEDEYLELTPLYLVSQKRRKTNEQQ